MIDLKFLKEKRDEIIDNIKKRNMKLDFLLLEKIAKKRSEALQKVEELRTKRNKIASDMKTKLDEKKRQLLIDEGKALKDEIAKCEELLAEVEAQYNSMTQSIPNFPDKDAPVRDNGDLSNIVIKKHGEPTKFSFKPKDHLELGKMCDILDFDTAARVSGQKFYYLKNEAVLLELALEQYAIATAVKHGFIPMLTPDIARTEILEGIGFSPRGDESNIYALEGGNECLVGTAEITLGGYYAGQTIPKSELPIRFVGLSHCFRREAGGAGQYSKGLYRVHQFSKVEMFVYTTPDKSREEHKKLLSIEEELFQGLGLAYQVIDTPLWDLGAPASRKFDIEAWLPGRGDNGEYGEVTSTSNCTDYQARSLKIKYKDEAGKTDYLHTLNGTAIAISRALVAIIENYQNKDGSITIPKALLPYMAGIEKIPCRK